MEDCIKSEIAEIVESRKRSREEDEPENTEDNPEVSPKRPNNQTTVYFKVLVPSTAAGAIIGKGGDTINQLQADTATNIKMSKGGDFFPGTTDRVCMIIGSVDNVRKVHAFILDKIKEKPDVNPGGIIGEVKAKIVVPNSTASLIIGKNGDNIKLIKDSTNVFIQVSPKSTNAEKPLSERIITVSGDAHACETAVNMILEKIVEDPQSGTCTNVSYLDGPVLPPSSIASLFSTNLTSSLHLPVTGHPTMEALKFILRAKGYNEPATREITAAMYTLASYGFIHLRPPPIPAVNPTEWATSTDAASSAEYYSQAASMAAAQPDGSSAAANSAATQSQDQTNYANYYNSYYNAQGSYNNGGYNPVCNFDGSGYSNYSSYSGMPSGMQPDMSGYSMGQGSYSAAAAAAAGGNYPGNYSMGGYCGGMMGDYGGTGGSSAAAAAAPPPPPSNDSSSMTKQEIDVADHVVPTIMGPEGKGLMDIQQWCGVGMELVKKGPGLHTAKIMGTQACVQSALYIVQQYIQHAEYQRFYEGQTAQQ